MQAKNKNMFEVPDTTKPDIDDSFIDLGGLDEFLERFENDLDFRKNVKVTVHERLCPNCNGVLRFDSTIRKKSKAVAADNENVPREKIHSGTWICDECGWVE